MLSDVAQMTGVLGLGSEEREGKVRILGGVSSKSCLYCSPSSLDLMSNFLIILIHVAF